MRILMEEDDVCECKADFMAWVALVFRAATAPNTARDRRLRSRADRDFRQLEEAFLPVPVPVPGSPGCW